MNISLTHELATLVEKKVKSGMYHTASEVVREGLRLLQEQDLLKQQRLRALRREIAIGMSQAERGESIPLNVKNIVARLKKRR